MFWQNFRKLTIFSKKLLAFFPYFFSPKIMQWRVYNIFCDRNQYNFFLFFVLVFAWIYVLSSVTFFLFCYVLWFSLIWFSVVGVFPTFLAYYLYILLNISKKRSGPPIFYFIFGMYLNFAFQKSKFYQIDNMTGHPLLHP